MQETLHIFEVTWGSFEMMRSTEFKLSGDTNSFSQILVSI